MKFTTYTRLSSYLDHDLDFQSEQLNYYTRSEDQSNARTQVQKYDLFITTIYIQQSVNKFIPFVSASSPFLLLLSSSLLSAKNIFFASNKSPSISISRLASKKIPRKITLIFNLN